MKRHVVWKISVATTTEAEEAVCLLLGEVFETPASTTFDLANGTTTVSVFLECPPARWAAQRALLRKRLCALTPFGPKAESVRISVRRLPPQDWAESWKRHFKPLEIGGKLLVKPSWSRRKPILGQAEVVLDPGLSFGTGQHATTMFCLHQLVKHRRPGTRQSVLDVGTGSGILAISAAKLGYSPVHAFDLDPEAVRTARANARRNRVAAKARILLKDLQRQSRPTATRYDLVCANLLTSLLIQELRLLAGFVRSGGLLVLAGILDREFAAVRLAYEKEGFCMLSSRREREWRSGCFVANQRRGSSSRPCEAGR